MIDINEEEKESLYYKLDECLKFCNDIKEEVYEDFTYYHVFWNIGLPPSDKHTLPIKSYLATQNLENTKLVVWSNVDLTNNEYLKPYFDEYLNNLEFRIYDPIKESVGTEIEGKTNILLASDSLNWCKGDLFRILILNNYGGVYVDFDVAFLRDFAPLLSQEFMYKWGREKNMINGAIMRLKKNSNLCKQLLHEISIGPVQPGSTLWSTILYEKVRLYNKDWIIFPSGFFNSEWQDTNIDLWNPMKKYDFKMYEGAFSWHWHNKWSDVIEIDSKFYTINKKMNEILNQKR
jgi:hypothetical protein